MPKHQLPGSLLLPLTVCTLPQPGPLLTLAVCLRAASDCVPQRQGLPQVVPDLWLLPSSRTAAVATVANSYKKCINRLFSVILLQHPTSSLPAAASVRSLSMRSLRSDFLRAETKMEFSFSPAGMEKLGLLVSTS